MLWARLIFLITVFISLTGCQQQRYTQFFENPTLLSSTLTACQQGKTSKFICTQAIIAQQVLSEFNRLSTNFVFAQQKFLSLQQQLQADPDNVILQDAFMQEQDTLNQEFTLLQENFAQQIIVTEALLVNLQNLQQQVRIKIKKLNSTNTVEKAVLSRQEILLNQQIDFIKEKIKGMLAFVGLSNPVSG